MNFVVLWLFAKVFSTNFGVWCSLAWQKQAIYEHFCFFHQLENVFSLKSFLLFGTLVHRSYCQWNYLAVVHVVTV